MKVSGGESHSKEEGVRGVGIKGIGENTGWKVIKNKSEGGRSAVGRVANHFSKLHGLGFDHLGAK